MLDKKLAAYAKSDYYPFHMPGHKRNPLCSLPNPYSIDITEIDGFDNLHEAEGILKESQNRAAKLYGSDYSYYLINGSTCGILAAISAAVPPGSTLLMARNVHKSVYHGAYLRGLTTEYLNPVMTEYGIQGAIDPKQIREKLKENKNIKGVVITSPTYEGIVSDVQTIANILHEHEIPLIVDEAHGAHFGFSQDFPQSAVALGADVVIQSMHKVLPSLTQTALLHLNSKYIKPENIEKFLGIYETSSPSYVLMASMEKCICLLEERKEELFRNYAKELKNFIQKTREFSHINIMKKEDFSSGEIFNLDPSKIVISVKDTNMTGKELYEELLHKYHLQLELVSGFYVLAMTSIMDSKEGFERLFLALKEIDSKLDYVKETDISDFVHKFYKPAEKKLELYEAMELPVKEVSFDEAAGKISGGFVSLYPPGVPVLLPGEIISEDCINNIRESIRLRLNLQGITDIINERIKIIKFE